MPKKRSKGPDGNPAKAKAEDDKELQRKYMQLQIIKQQLSALVEEKTAVTEKLTELSTTIEAMKKLPGVNKGEEMWSSIGSGAFVRSDIKDTDNVFVAVGAGVVMKEARGRGIEILAGRLEQLQKIDTQLAEEINKFAEAAAKLEQELQHAVENR